MLATRQLIPDPYGIAPFRDKPYVSMDQGSVTNVMEEPAVELPLLTGHSFIASAQPQVVSGLNKN